MISASFSFEQSPIVLSYAYKTINMKSVETILLNSGLTTQSITRGHLVTNDMPAEEGGKDMGMKPLELLLASLGSCIAITLKIYANHKNWDLGEVKINLELDEAGPTPIINKKIQLGDHITEEQKKRILNISEKCHVSKILSKGIEINLID